MGRVIDADKLIRRMRIDMDRKIVDIANISRPVGMAK
jgi:hypothetical protein